MTPRAALRLIWPAACLALTWVALAGRVLAFQVPEPGMLPVEVAPQGVFTTLPTDGLHLVGDLPVHLREPFAEWFGVAFDGPDGHVEAVGTGSRSDWALRRPVTVTDYVRSDTSVLAVSRSGPLEIRHEVHQLSDGATIWVIVLLKNVGYETLRNVTYTREWVLPDASGTTWPPEADLDLDAPPDITRIAWQPRDLPYKGSAGHLLVFSSSSDGPPPPVDLFLELWVTPAFQTGLPIGATNGISLGDYDADGWFDIYANESAELWRNVGGRSWELAADLDSVLPPAEIRYGAAFADYNNDGFPDIGTEPRDLGLGLDRCFHLLENTGGGSFVDVSTDPVLMDAPVCNLNAETICWGDVNGDGNLDMLLPAYPAWSQFPGPGNLFVRNVGPGPTGYQFVDDSAGSGLANPPGTSRPEGAQFCDYDGDGDIDLFSNGTIYQNQSGQTDIDFQDISDQAGISFRDQLDEGALFTDFDMDGDYDLIVSYLEPTIGNRIYENRGDGSFLLTDPEIITNWFTGVGLGLSAEDWDNDGDMDLSTRQFFRKNLLMETGEATYWFFNHTMDVNHLSSATPAWGDWDKDGDLDGVIGNWLSVGHLYDNKLYEPDTPARERRHVRVHVVRDKASVPEGLETEFGASVEITVQGAAADGHRRKKFVASGHGYLNQSEYGLHFALPADPFPGNAGQDVHFDVAVDFPTREDQGLWRVDKHVNPALGDINLADLSDREIRVWRSGKVRIDGAVANVTPSSWPRLDTAGGGLALPTTGAALPDPSATPGADHFVGIELNTAGASGTVDIREVLLDGQLDTAVCAPGYNLALWDVTTPAAPVRVHDLAATTAALNRRTTIPVDWTVQPDRVYRLVARVTESRLSPLLDSGLGRPIAVTGGLGFTDATPCGGASVSAAAVDGASLPLTIRYNALPTDTWENLASGLGGVLGVPNFQGLGVLAPSTPMELRLSLGAPNSLAWLLVGFTALNDPFMGGVLVPSPDVVVSALPLNGAGALNFGSLWPNDIPSGFTLWMQYWIMDPMAVQGFAASNALKATTP